MKEEKWGFPQESETQNVLSQFLRSFFRHVEEAEANYRDLHWCPHRTTRIKVFHSDSASNRVTGNALEIEIIG